MVDTGQLPEIPANHKPFAQEIIYRAFVLPSLTGQFQRIRLAMQGHIPTPQQGPLIVYLTHTSWWDAYMLFLISYHLLANSFQNYIMMEAKQLRVYRFFAWCGAFSIDRAIPGDAERSIQYIVGQLRERPDRCLWMFPQGRLAPASRRPLLLYPGIARILAQTGSATLLPVALRYEFRGTQKPEAFIYCGSCHQIEQGAAETALLEQLTQRLTLAADQVHADVCEERFDGYQTILTGRQGLNHWLDSLRMRMTRRSASSKH
jgi:chlorobactene lauroyltransferase